MSEKMDRSFENKKDLLEGQNRDALGQYQITLEQKMKELQGVCQQLEVTKTEFDKFAFSVGHDLRAPLTHIMGFMQLLEEKINDKLDDKAREYFKIVKDATLRLGNMLEVLSAYSRLVRTNVTVAPTNLDAVVKEILLDCSDKTKNRNIQWTIEKLPTINGDGLLLKNALQHLIDNAIKFTAPRDVATIKVGALQENKNQWVIFVQDNGVGFDDTKKNKLFALFQRLHSQEAFEGLGTGLAMVRQCMHKLGGEVDVSSKIDQGATFSLTLNCEDLQNSPGP